MSVNCVARLASERDVLTGQTETGAVALDFPVPGADSSPEGIPCRQDQSRA
jgi:hypothetical protein